MQGLLIKNSKELEVLDKHGFLYILRHQRRSEGIHPLKDYNRIIICNVKVTLLDLIKTSNFREIGDKYLDRSGHETVKEWLHSYGNNTHSRIWIYRIERMN